MNTFEYNAALTKVIFRSGTLSKLLDEVARLSLLAPLLRISCPWSQRRLVLARAAASQCRNSLPLLQQ
jgi:hypothetical protein